MNFERTPSLHDHYAKEQYYFWDSGRMLVYVNVHYPHSDNEVAYIIDTISAKAFNLISPKYQELFRTNGFMPDECESPALRGKGMQALEAVLADIHERKPQIALAVVCTKETSREYFEKSLFRYFSQLPKFVRRLAGGGDGAVATFIFKR